MLSLEALAQSVGDSIAVPSVTNDALPYMNWLPWGLVAVGAVMLVAALLMKGSTMAGNERGGALLGVGLSMIAVSPIFFMISADHSYPDAGAVRSQMFKHGVIVDSADMSGRMLTRGGTIPGSFRGEPVIVELSSVKNGDDEWIIRWEAE